MSKCVLVIGTPRSGTSLTGGILDALGVWMGDTPMPAGPHNPKGTFNCDQLETWLSRAYPASFPASDEACNVSPEQERSLQEILIERQARGVPFGLKATRLWAAWKIIRNTLTVPVKVIFTNRQAERVRASWESAFNNGHPHSRDLTAEAFASLRYFRSVNPWPCIDISFDELVDNSDAVRRIAEFVGLPVTDAALAFPTPDLRRF